MTSALGPDVLALLLPAVDVGHPVARQALAALPGMEGSDREAVVSALLSGPYAAGRAVGVALPKAVVSAVADEADAAAERGHTGYVDPMVQGHLLEVVARHASKDEGPMSVPSRLANAAWATRWPLVRSALLTHDGVTASRKTRWLHAAEVNELGFLLTPGTDPLVVELVVAEVKRRTPKDSAYTLERASSPAPAEELLSARPVDETALVDLCRALPSDPQWRPSDERGEHDEVLRTRWSTLVGWIARTQVHLWEPVAEGEVLTAWARPDEDDKKRSEEEQKLLFHLGQVEWRWTDSVPGLVDLLPDEQLERVVGDAMHEAGQAQREADWWEARHRELEAAGTAIQDWVPTDDEFNQWLRSREDALLFRRKLVQRHRGAELSVEELDERYARHCRRMREWFDRKVKDGPAEAAGDARWSGARDLIRVLPVMDGKVRASVRPSERVTGRPESVWERDGRWTASYEVRARLADWLRAGVFDLVLPYPPSRKSYLMGEWAKLAAAAVSSSRDVNEIPADVREVAWRAAAAWLRENRSSYWNQETSNALEQVVRMLSKPVPVTPKPPSSEELARESLAALRNDTDGPGGGPSQVAVDAVLARA